MRVSRHLLMPLLVGSTYGLLLVILLVSLYFMLKRCSCHRWRRSSAAAGFKGNKTPSVRAAVPANVSPTVVTSSPQSALSSGNDVGKSLVPRRCPARSKKALPIKEVKSTVVDVGQEAANRSRPNSMPTTGTGLVFIPFNGQMKYSCPFPSGSSLHNHCGKDACRGSCTKGHLLRGAKNSTRTREQRASALVSLDVVNRDSRLKSRDRGDSQTKEISNYLLLRDCVFCAPSEGRPSLSRFPRYKSAYQSLDTNKGHKVYELDTAQGVFVSFSQTPPFTRLSSTKLAVDGGPVPNSRRGEYSGDIGGTESGTQLCRSSSCSGHSCLSPLCTPHRCPSLVRSVNKLLFQIPRGQCACLPWTDHCSRSRQEPGLTRIMTCPRRATDAARKGDVSKRQERSEVDGQWCKRRKPSASQRRVAGDSASRCRKTSPPRAGIIPHRCRGDVPGRLHVAATRTRSDKLQVRMQEESGDSKGAETIETGANENRLPTVSPGHVDVGAEGTIATADDGSQLLACSARSNCVCAKGITVTVADEPRLSAGLSLQNAATTRTDETLPRACSPASGHVSCASTQTSAQVLLVRSQQFPTTPKIQTKNSTTDPERRQMLNINERMSSGQLTININIVGDDNNSKKIRLALIKERLSDLKVHQPGNTK